jgi:hypothetical protein
MKQTKKQLEEAILIVGDSLNMKDITEILLVNVGIHSTIKELSYKMFVENKQQYFEKDDNVFEAISLIRKYCQEMSKNGEVEFENN